MGMGGTLAKYSAEGVETYCVCASRGERGWFGPAEENPGLERVGQLRTRELENAAKELGIAVDKALLDTRNREPGEKEE